MQASTEPDDGGKSSSTGPSSTIRIVPLEATTADIEALLTVERAAFQHSAVMALLTRGRPGQGSAPVMRVSKHLANMATGNFIYHKAIEVAPASRVEDTVTNTVTDKDTDTVTVTDRDRDTIRGNLVGTAVWYLADDPHAESVNSPWGDPPPGTDPECFDAILGRLRRWRWQYFRDIDAPFAYLNLISVAPEAQRRGVGTALLRAGLKEVDRRGWHSYVAASPEGLKLYQKIGWVEKTRTVVNLKEYGGPDEEAVTVALVRPPHGAGVKSSTK